jgi:hypothetical protein
MNLYILSMRALASTVPLDTILELEDLLVRTCEAKILTPVPSQIFLKSWQIPITGVRQLTQKVVKKTIGCYELADLPLNSGKPNILITIAMRGGHLDLLSSIPNWRKKFDLVLAYVFDCWVYEDYSTNVRYLDRLFVPVPEVIEPLKQKFNIPVSLMPFGADVLGQGSNQLNRLIDLISFGRIPDKYNLAFLKKFNAKDSETLYYRSTPRSQQGFPIPPDKQLRDKLDAASLFSMLRKSKMMLAFDTLCEGMREFPYSVLTLRWFFGLSAGCAILGKAPTTPLAKELLDWENATIELPDDPLKSCEFIEELAKNTDLLHSIHRKNYREALARHDWRYRIKDVFKAIDVSLPPKLSQELTQLDTLLQQVDRGSN